jgi:hypothetical protein
MSFCFTQLASLRPPFLGDSFPALKRAVTLGRYPALPGKYSDGLTRVIAQMLKLDSRSRPSADMLLKSGDVACMLQLDETSTSFGQAAPGPGENQPLSLINTIKVPQHLRKLNSALPKPCYPDVRPNSPTSWTVAEQKAQRDADREQAVLRAAQRKPAPLPPVPALPLPTMTDLPTAPLSNKENLHPIPTHRSDCSDRDHKLAKHVGFVPAPPAPATGVPTAAVADFYARRPLAPAQPLQPSNRANLAPHRPGAPNGGNTAVTPATGAPYKVPGLAYHRPAAFKPSLDAVTHDRENHAPAPPLSHRSEYSVPSVAYDKHHSHQHQARAPPRLQYQHNRVW